MFPAFAVVLAPFGFPEHHPAMVFQGLATALEHLSAAPLAQSFQAMSFLLHRFAAAHLGTGNLFLTFRASFPSFPWRRIGINSYEQD
jgi:hypothetical protein